MFVLNSDVRKITSEKCVDMPSNPDSALKLDFERSQFIVKKNFSSVAGSRILGQLWLVLDPLIQAAIYFFVLVVLRARRIHNH